MMAPRTRPAGPLDHTAIAGVHRSAFPGFFLTRMGAPFLAAYYGIVADFPGGILLVAEDGGRLAGFVSGFLDPCRFYEAMSAARGRLLWPTLRGVLRDPLLLPLILANRRRVGDAARPEGPGAALDCELSSIAVHPDAQGKGLGRELVRSFFDAAAERGARSVLLTTDDLNNDRAHEFYRGLGFERVGEPEHRGARVMARYVYRFGPASP
ncbi:MAG TPA: GNAT family N-acetyltransferase [Isosphaeraceae bacterium]|nr:GNAT family N-acetyltransferase [Isosphaeraceae bacterium]